MGVIIPQVITSDRASGAQLIDGSLKFDGSKNTKLEKTFASAGNRQSWTWSCWVKRDTLNLSNRQVIFGGYGASNDTDWLEIGFDDGDDHVYFTTSSITGDGTAQRRDTNGWYHFFSTYDGSTLKIFVNERLDLSHSFSGDRGINNNTAHFIGNSPKDSDVTLDRHLDGKLSQCYFIDGQVLNTSDFVFTDPLTNILKPKKYTGTFGTNGFWLPMDGNSPIGEDKSGNGNDFEPVNFGSVALDSPAVSGARPILNTTQGGTQAGIGVFGSKENKTYTVTYADDGGGNKYYIDGVKQATLTGLIRGATYTFNTVALGSTHPFRLSATSAHGTEYTNGVKAVTGAATTITIPHDAPDSLYYYCTAHSGMGSSITNITTDETKADPYAWKCILAVPGVGGNSSDISPSIACTSIKKSNSEGGDPSSDPSYNFYGSSIDLDGNDKVTYTRTNAGDFSAQSDFTIEAWFNTDTTGATDAALFSNWDSGDNRSILFGPNASGSGKFTFIFNTTGSGSWTTLANPTAIAGKWIHVAWVYDHSATRHYAFLNGTLQGSATGTAYNNSTANFLLGVNKGDGSGYFNGKVQDLRYYHTIKYSAPGITTGRQYFVPTSSNPDIIIDTPSGVSGSSKLTKITEGSVYFPGADDDKLTITSTELTQLGSSDWTVECFHYATRAFAGSTGVHLVQCWDSGWAFTIADATGDRVDFVYKKGGTTYEVKGKTPLEDHRWYHLAATRSGNTIRVFVDGVEDGSATETGSIASASSTTLTIGNHPSSSDYHTYGFISDLRIVKGTALYTSTFTAPTEPLTNVTNTKLLCCQSNVTSGAAATSPNMGGINDGTVWSSIVTGPTRVEDRVSNAFKGSSGSPGAIPAYPGTLRFEPGITGISTLAVRGYHAGSGVTLHVNGNAQSPSSGSAFDIGITTTSLDSIVWTATNGFNYYRIDQVEIDGNALVDPVQAEDDGDEVPSNFTPFNTDIHTVRGQETGYPTMNPLAKNSDITLEDGNLRITQTDSHGQKKIVYSNAKIPYGGKWYVEWIMGGGGACTLGMGINGKVEFRGSDTQIGTDTNSWGYEPQGNLFHNGNQGGSFGSCAAGDVIGMTIDTSGDTLTIQWHKNGVLIRNGNNIAEFTDISLDEDYIVMMSHHTPNYDTLVNFGQKPFKFPPPDGFQPLNTANTRPVNVISRPDQFVGIITYVGAGATKTFTGLNFGDVPDLVWMKNRDRTSYGDGTSAHHYLYDTVRGTGTGKMLTPSTTEVEGSKSTEADLDGFVRDGFRLDAASGTDCINNSGDDFIAWCWKAGGNKNTFNVDDVGYASAAAAGLDGGSIAVTGASVGTKQGFSIIKYSGTGTAGTISHGLLEQPKFVIIKDLKNANAWAIQHVGTTLGTGLLKFNTDDVDSTVASAVWNSTAPTSSVFSVGTSGDTNYTTNSAEYIAYLWHDVPGLQKFGVYEGNGNTNGTFVELGFRPALLWRKGIDNNSRGWYILDNERNKHNPTNTFLDAADNDQDGTGTAVDFLSNGFKLRNSDAGTNHSETYIYCAWAAAPSIDLFGGGANAR